MNVVQQVGHGFEGAAEDANEEEVKVVTVSLETKCELSPETYRVEHIPALVFPVQVVLSQH